MKVTTGTDFSKVERVQAEDTHRGAFAAVTGDQVTCP